MPASAATKPEECSQEDLAGACDDLIDKMSSLLIDLGYIVSAKDVGKKIAIEDAEATIRRVATIARALRKTARESSSRLRVVPEHNR
jgi:hypothetical protein